MVHYKGNKMLIGVCVMKVESLTYLYTYESIPYVLIN
jgi:hypothetical protein